MTRVNIVNEPVSALMRIISEVFGTSPNTLRLILGVLGMVLLATSLIRKKSNYSQIIASGGWVLIGLFIYLQSSYYVKIEDYLLVLMTAMALPGGILIAYLEIKDEYTNDSIIWFRGTVAWSMIPYYLVYLVPHLNVAFVLMTAHSAELMLEFVGLGSYTIGDVMVSLEDGGEVPLSEWSGSMWILTQPLGDAGFYVPMYYSNGEEVNISFILSCSGLQSMIIFVGAICALDSVPWNRRLRGLFISIPTIHILNTFRNAGIVWLTESYPEWTFFKLNMFDFAHSYAAKGVSLFAMFLMAIALFDLLPELHRNIMKLIPKKLQLTKN
tara:strand:- start:11079 stop:12056 length:978 start_codon:yes stop_codon:yes gene_type:complete